jgi:hypothetical protein
VQTIFASLIFARRGDDVFQGKLQPVRWAVAWLIIMVSIAVAVDAVLTHQAVGMSTTDCSAPAFCYGS